MSGIFREVFALRAAREAESCDSIGVINKSREHSASFGIFPTVPLLQDELILLLWSMSSSANRILQYP
jgi:hypothetical protein